MNRKPELGDRVRPADLPRARFGEVVFVSERLLVRRFDDGAEQCTNCHLWDGWEWEEPYVPQVGDLVRRSKVYSGVDPIRVTALGETKFLGWQGDYELTWTYQEHPRNGVWLRVDG